MRQSQQMLSAFSRLLTAEEKLVVECNVFVYCGNLVGKEKKGKEIIPSFCSNFLDFPSFFQVFCK